MDLATIGVIIIGIVVVNIVYWLRKNRAVVDAEVENFVVGLPDDVERVVRAAAKIGADFAESVDLDGKLLELMGGYSDKSEAKLNLAVETAVMWVEFQLKNVIGLDIDIPEELIKRYINGYVFQHRDEYPEGDEVAQ